MAAATPQSSVFKNTEANDTQPRLSSAIAPKVHPKKVIAIGDSLVYGYGDSEGGGWVERLRRGWLNPDTPGPIIYNLGVRGDGVQQVSDRLSQEFSKRGELRHRLPDVLILSVGVNDCARAGRPTGRPLTDLPTFERKMSQLLHAARQLCPVYFVGMVPVNEAAMPFADILYFSRADQIAYRNLTCALCDEQQIPYLDLYDQWATHSDEWIGERLCWDGIHPNALGYCTILDAISSWRPLMSALT